jgi:hypothetical protein
MVDDEDGSALLSDGESVDEPSVKARSSRLPAVLLAALVLLILLLILLLLLD